MTSNKLRRAAAIVGVGESDTFGFDTNKTSLMLHTEAIINATNDAGLDIDEIDGLFVTGGAGRFPAIAMAEYLGIQPKYVDNTYVGGAGFIVFVNHAVAAINAGIIDTAVISHGEVGHSVRQRGNKGTGGGFNYDPWDPSMQFEQIYGLWGAPAYYAHAMNRYMHEFNVSKEDFAQIAVVAREWATLNPTAVMHSKETHPFGGPIDIKTVLDSRPIAWPLNLLDCCLVTDHGGAVVIASKDRANDFKNTPVWIDGSGEAISHINMSQMQDMTETSAKESSKRAYAMAGLGPADMEMAMLYDSFTYTAGVTAEMVGLAPRGQGTDLWKNGAASPGGKFPINTNGGGLSYSHSGMYGILLLIEAQRQLAQKAIGLPGRQTHAKSAIINGTGGPLAATGTIIVSVDK